MSSPPSQLQMVLDELVTRCYPASCCSSRDYQMLKVEEVPEMFQEPYIYSGYRQMDRPWSYYLRSIFMLHNESINVWTHSLGIFSVLYSLLACLRNLNVQYDGHARCVLFFGVCCLVNLALSATAHLFHSKSRWHHFAFLFLDYMGVSFFIFGSGVVSMYICSSKPFHDLFSSWFLPANVFLSWFAFFACVYSKVKLGYNNSHRKGMLLAGVVSQAIVIALPTAWRLVECVLQPTCELHHLRHLIIMFFMLIMCGVTFGCQVPESLWPGHFDVLGHAHQWFHVTAVLAMMTQMWAIDVDMNLDQRAKQLKQPGTGELLVFLIALVVIESATAVYYMRSVPDSETSSQSLLGKETQVDYKVAATNEEDSQDFLSKCIESIEMDELHEKKQAEITRKQKEE